VGTLASGKCFSCTARNIGRTATNGIIHAVSGFIDNVMPRPVASEVGASVDVISPKGRRPLCPRSREWNEAPCLAPGHCARRYS
jgi:hypothetical protein